MVERIFPPRSSSNIFFSFFSAMPATPPVSTCFVDNVERKRTLKRRGIVKK